MAKGTMKLINASTGLMECRVCGYRHTASIKPGSGGKFYRGSWQCPKCKEKQAEKLAG